MRTKTVCVASLLFSVICGACGGGATTVVRANSGAQRDLVDSDPGSAEKLKSALAQLAELLGHGVDIQVDNAFGKSRSTLAGETAFIEELVRNATTSKKYNQQRLLVMQSYVHHVAFEYDASGLKRTDIDKSTKTLVVRLRNVDWWDRGEQRSSLLYALDRAENADAESAFQGKTAATVDKRDFQTFFRWKTHDTNSDKDAKTAPELANDPRASRILELLTLWQRADEGQVKRDVQSWLAQSGGGYFRRTAESNEALLGSVPSDSVYRRAETAWAKWALALWTSPKSLTAPGDLKHGDLYDLSEQSFFRPRDARGSSRGDTQPTAGLDATRIFEDAAKAWIAAGYPFEGTAGQPSSPMFQWYAAIIRPREGALQFAPGVSQDTFNRYSSDRGRVSGDHTEFYAYLWEEPTRRTRLLSFLGTQKDRALTYMVFANLLKMHANSAELVRAAGSIPGDAKMGEVALRTLALLSPESDAFRDQEDRVPVVDELQKLWRANPALRGAALYFFTAIERRKTDKWPVFDKIFGARVSQAEFASYLSQDPEAVDFAADAVQAIAPGWSPTSVLLPHVDAYLADAGIAKRRRQPEDGMLRAWVNARCQAHQPAELAMVHAYVQSRVASHPAEASRWSRLLDESSAMKCEETSKRATRLSDPFQRQ